MQTREFNRYVFNREMIRKLVLIASAIIAFVILAQNVPFIIAEGEITEGQRIYENIREQTASDSADIRLAQKDAYPFVQYVELAVVGAWKARLTSVSVSILVLILVFAGWPRRPKVKT